MVFTPLVTSALFFCIESFWFKFLTMPSGECPQDKNDSRSAFPSELTILVAGIFLLNPAFVNAAQQCVPVPYVETRIKPDTPRDFSSFAMACPILLMISTIPASPVVLKNSS